MTLSEMATILLILQEQYTDKEVTDATINAWYPIFENVPYQACQLAVLQMAKEKTFSKFPVPGEIFQYIKQMDDSDERANVLWEQVRRCVGKGSIMTQEDFNALPEELKAWFGSLNQIRDFGRMDIDVFNSVTRGQFFKQVPVLIQRVDTQNQMAPELKALMKGHKLLEG